MLKRKKRKNSKIQRHQVTIILQKSKKIVMHTQQIKNNAAGKNKHHVIFVKHIL